MANKKAMSLTKFSGSPDDVPVEKWLRLFNTKAESLGWTDQDKVRNFHEYVENDAFKWYLSDVFDTNETWSDVHDRMVARFGSPVVDPFRAFIHRRLKRGETVKGYYDEKRRLGHLAELRDSHIVSGLTDGLPPEMEIAFAGVSVTSPIQWFTVAQRVESSRARSRAPPTFADSTSVRQPIQNRPTPPTSARNSGVPPKYECRICSSLNIHGQMHWHSDCPNKPRVNYADEDQGNAISEYWHSDCPNKLRVNYADENQGNAISDPGQN